MGAAKPIAVCIISSDPYASDLKDTPRLAGYYDGKTEAMFKGPDCAAALAAYILKQPESVIYCRNAGRREFYHLVPWIERSEITVIDSRVVKCRIGSSQLRDSWAILPFPLYENGYPYGSSISQCLKDEYALCSRFREEFGDFLTVGGVSAMLLKKSCPFWTGAGSYDRFWRDRFYFGGRNEMFGAGVIEGNIHSYDVRSGYPAAMRDLKHPIGTTAYVSDAVSEKTFLVSCRGHNHGAFCVRNPETGALNFSVPYGDFNVTIHEFNAAIETGAFECDKVIEAYSWDYASDFKPFVDPLYARKLRCSMGGDYWGSEMYKYVLNGGYGKFAQNPARYSDYHLTEYGKRPPTDARWVPAYVTNTHDRRWMLWKKPARHPVFLNIATAASITGAARAKLLRGIMATPAVLYCDTDSIISDGPASLNLGYGIGEWKLEHQATSAAFVRKKIYALFSGRKCIKLAHSGCALTGDEILRAARGERLVKIDTAPTFTLAGNVYLRSYTVGKD